MKNRGGRGGRRSWSRGELRMTDCLKANKTHARQAQTFNLHKKFAISRLPLASTHTQTHTHTTCQRGVSRWQPEVRLCRDPGAGSRGRADCLAGSDPRRSWRRATCRGRGSNRGGQQQIDKISIMLILIWNLATRQWPAAFFSLSVMRPVEFPAEFSSWISNLTQETKGKKNVYGKFIFICPIKTNRLIKKLPGSFRLPEA